MQILRTVYARARQQAPPGGHRPPTAELVKVAANAFLATKISFINAMADICETVGADVVLLADAIGHDARIGRKFLNAGIGYGGGCLPKDIRAFQHRATELGADDAADLLHHVDAVNRGAGRRWWTSLSTSRGPAPPGHRPGGGVQAAQ